MFAIAAGPDPDDVAVGRPDEGLPTKVKLMVTKRESRAIHRGYFNSRIWKPAK